VKVEHLITDEEVKLIVLRTPTTTTINTHKLRDPPKNLKPIKTTTLNKLIIIPLNYYLSLILINQTLARLSFSSSVSSASGQLALPKPCKDTYTF